MDTIKNIQKISLLFFIIIGFSHLLSSFIISNNYYQEPFFLINRTLDMPFILAAASYGLTSLKLNLEANIGRSRLINALLILIGTLIIGFAIYINLFIPDR